MIAFVRKYFGWLFTLFVKLADKIEWRAKYRLSASDLDMVKQILSKDYFLICTRSPNHLTTWLIVCSDWLFTGNFGYYSHCLLNLEDDVKGLSDFRLLEATLKKGVTFTPFDEAFNDVSSIALLKPKSFDMAAWTKVMDQAKQQLGKQYDTLYDFTQEKRCSCITLLANALKKDPNWTVNYANFFEMLDKHGEITPHMLYTCPDFQVVFELRVEK